MHAIELTHYTDTGHRIPGHGGGSGKCARLHGHTYRFDIQATTEALDGLHMVADFGRIKEILNEWDHRTLLWADDPFYIGMVGSDYDADATAGIVRVPFIPTAEAMAQYLSYRFLAEFSQLAFVQVDVRETEKTKARFYASQADRERVLAEVEAA